MPVVAGRGVRLLGLGGKRIVKQRIGPAISASRSAATRKAVSATFSTACVMIGHR